MDYDKLARDFLDALTAYDREHHSYFAYYLNDKQDGALNILALIFEQVLGEPRDPAAEAAKQEAKRQAAIADLKRQLSELGATPQPVGSPHVGPPGSEVTGGKFGG